MSRERRVLIVARHYWPTTSDQTLRLRQWAMQLQRESMHVHVVTPQWHASWPNRMVCQGVTVHRIEHPPTTRFRTSRYWRNLVEWVAREMSAYGCIYCDAADGDAHALLTQLPKAKQPPVVVRFDPRELPPAAAGPWTPTPRCTDSCRRAALVIAPTAASQRHLLSMGIASENVLRLADPPGGVIDRTPAMRHAARGILSQVNHDLLVRKAERVVLCPGELTREWGVDFLIRALGPLVEQQRCLKLWILGDGPERQRFYELLQYEGLHRLVSMPGVFTCLEQLLQVADLCVLPAESQGNSWLLPTCVANQIPVLCADSVESRGLLGEQSRVLCFPAKDEAALRKRVGEWLHSPRAIECASREARAAWVQSITAAEARLPLVKAMSPQMARV